MCVPMSFERTTDVLGENKGDQEDPQGSIKTSQRGGSWLIYVVTGFVNGQWIFRNRLHKMW